MVDRPAGSPRRTRLESAVTFVVIVWLVAGSFAAFEIAAIRGMDIALAYPSLFGRVLLSDALQESTACVVGPGERGDRRPAPATLPPRALGWSLGIQLGQDAVARQWSGIDPDVLEASARDIGELAAQLGVPGPRPFVPMRKAEALGEFSDLLERDPQGTAHRLAVLYAPEACESFKLGAYWGYSALLRSVVPDGRAAYSVQIHHYAQRLGIPETLWQPMIARPPGNPTRKAAGADAERWTEAMRAYLERGGT